MIIKFKFDLGEIVKTVDGRKGRITGLMHSEAGNKYEVSVSERAGSLITLECITVNENKLTKSSK